MFKEGSRKLSLGVLMGLTYLLSATLIALSAIEAARDLTATGIMLGTIGASVAGLVTAVVWGNRAEHGK